MTTMHEQKPDDLAKRVLGRIEEEHLLPRPRWEFLFKNYAFWTLGALAVVFGALAFSATLFEVQNVDWALSPATHADSFSFFLETAPFFWTVALALFTLVGYLYIRRTKHGYRYPLVAILSCAALVSFASGTGLYAVGFGGTVEESLGDHPGLYRPVLAQQRSWWAAPEKGLLSGEVATATPITASSSLIIHDFSGKEWNVDTSDLRERDLRAVMRGGPVRVVGAPATSSTGRFHACFVFPWQAKGPRGRNNPPPQRPARVGIGADDTSDVCKNIRPYKDLRDVNEQE